MSSLEDPDGSHEYEIEPESDTEHESTPSVSDGEDDVVADDPLADEEWTAQYERELEQEKELEKELNERLKGRKIISEWCTCGNCSVSLLVNISECYCCSELEGCLESTQTDLVRQDIESNTTLKCVTQHPGFQPMCLQKWSLRLAAGKFRTTGKQRYKQKGSEDSFLRSVAYREFSRLVYGFLGNNKRID